MHTRYRHRGGGVLHGMWVSRSPVTALVVANTPTFSRVLDIPSPLSVSSICVRVRVSVRRCCRFSGLYAFRSSDSVVVSIRRPRIVVLVSYNATANSTQVLWNFGSLTRWVRGSIPPLTPTALSSSHRSSPNLSLPFWPCGPKTELYIWNKVYWYNCNPKSAL